MACLAAGMAFVAAAGQTVPRGYEIIDITRDNGRYEESPRINNRGQVVFSSRVLGSPTDSEIWLYDSAITADLVVSAGTMSFTKTTPPQPNNCPITAPAIGVGGSISVTGGTLTFDAGFSIEGDEEALAPHVSITGGSVNSQGVVTVSNARVSIIGAGHFESYGTVNLSNVALEIGDDGALAVVDAPALLTNGGSINVEDDGHFGAMVVGAALAQSGYELTIDGTDNNTYSFSCVRFDLHDADLTINSGIFFVDGHDDARSDGSNCTITLDGGALRIAGGYAGQNSDLTIWGGLLEVLPHFRTNDVFHTGWFGGEFLYLGGTIKVREGEKMLAE
jgi:hypothetical protein